MAPCIAVAGKDDELELATGVSADSAKVGAASTGLSKREAFLWTPEAGMHRLSDVLV